MRRILLLAALAATLWLAWVHETRFPLRGLDDPPLTLVVPSAIYDTVVAALIGPLVISIHDRRADVERMDW